MPYFYPDASARGAPTFEGGQYCPSRLLRIIFGTLLFLVLSLDSETNFLFLNLRVSHEMSSFSSSTTTSSSTVTTSNLLSRSAALFSPETVTAMQRCHAARGRGVTYYASLPGVHAVDTTQVSTVVSPEDSSCGSERLNDGRLVTHCCIVGVKFQGLSGNILTQFNVARFHAELNSCAMQHIVFAGLEQEKKSVMGAQADVLGAQQWPPAGLLQLKSVGELRHSVDAFATLSRPASGLLTFITYPEIASWQYAALSLGWDLAGDTLIGRGIRGLNAVGLSGNATVERSQRWAEHREACALAGTVATIEMMAHHEDKEGASHMATLANEVVMEGMHPWTASGVRSEMEAILLGTHEHMTPSLRLLASAPERTIVVHLRLDEVYRRTVAGARERSRDGVVGAEWLGDMWAMQSPTLAAPKGETAAAQLAMLEASAARVDLVTPPLSFFRRVLRETRPAWDYVIVVGDHTLASNPLFMALRDEFNATLQSGSAVLDMATLALARQLIVSGASTFSFIAAAMGRARVIHAPHAGLLVAHAHHTIHGASCMLTHERFDDRWIFHDVFRAAIADVARVFAVQQAAARAQGLNDTSIVTREWARAATPPLDTESGHFEWRSRPLERAITARGAGCPLDNIDGVGARGLARALGKPTEFSSSRSSSSSSGNSSNSGSGSGSNEPVPFFFLTGSEVINFYRRPDCVRYFYPTFNKPDFVNGDKLIHTCVDDAPVAILQEIGPSMGCRGGPCS
jgi:hypothetical protein